jgi:hypothetical protein
VPGGGHTLGLGHQDESGASLGTCMDYAKDPTASQHPDQHDYEQLVAIYGHGDATTTVASGSAPAGSSSPADLHRRDEWGRAVRYAGGRPVLFERTLSETEKLFTWVIWA